MARAKPVRASYPHVFPEKTHDELLLEYAATRGRVFVTNDEPLEKKAAAWLSQGRTLGAHLLGTARLPGDDRGRYS
jgi:hypothetical protein